MDRLSNIVLIAGKNGSGKTRIFNKIFDTLKRKPEKQVVKDLLNEVHKRQNLIEKLQALMAQQKMKLNKASLTTHENTLQNSIKIIENAQAIINWDLVQTDKLMDRYIGIQFVPKNLNLKDSNKYRNLGPSF